MSYSKKKKLAKTSFVEPPVNSFHEYENIESENDSDGVFNDLIEESDESSEEEVLALNSGSDVDSSEDETDDGDDDDDQKNISDSDLDQPNNDLPDPKAWGKRKKMFYNADNINDKNDYLNEEDELAAKMEEDEGITIQKRLTSEIDSADLSLDLLSGIISEMKEKPDFEEKEKITVNLSQMNELEKLKLLKKESPKFLASIEDYKRLMKILQNDVLPVMKQLSPSQLQNSSAGNFLKTFCQMIMNYCTNISFYVLLKSRRSNCESHPIEYWVSHYQKILHKIEPLYETRIKPQIEILLNESSNSRKNNGGKKKKKSTIHSETDVNMESAHEFSDDDQMANSIHDATSVMESLMPPSDEEDDSGKRPISYQIAKNKGLTPRRKKELRNPRVKHRMKYRKAKIRRKGQIREVRKELQKYSGEISGIKAGVIKSIKLRN